jgi:carboxymethylenebutenolidase
MTGSSTTEKDSKPKNLGAVFDAHVRAEFVEKDVAATMATMTAEPYLTHVPTMTGGTGRAEVESFYHDHFVGYWPDDVQVKSISRTVRVAPTGRKVVLPHVVVMGFDETGHVAYEHIYWDQASLVVQVGLLDPTQLPVSGAEKARRLLDPAEPANEMIAHWRLKAK